MKAIGIDIGTTTISAVALDTEKKSVLESRTIPNDSFMEAEREWERIQDVSAIVKKAANVLDELLDRFPEAGAIGLTGQMHGIVYIDACGRCKSPLYTWQDQRGNLSGEDGKTAVELAQEAGCTGAAAGYGLVTHLYNCRMGLVPDEAAGLCTIPDYLGMVLTGRKKPLLHVSMAASLGFFDVEKGEFSLEQLQRAGMDPEFLPEVTAEVQILGVYRGRPVTTALGDNQASFLGSVGRRPDTVLLNVGTGGQISVLSEKYREVPGIETRPLTDGSYILVGASLCGGRAYAILEKFFRSYVSAACGQESSQYEVMEKLAGMSLPEDQMVVDTAFHGTRTEPGRRGSIRNLSEDNFTPEGLVRGVLIGLAEELYEMFRKIHESTGIEAKELVASGNGVRKNRVLQQIFEQMFGARLELAHYNEEAACGAALSSAGAPERRKSEKGDSKSDCPCRALY